MENCGDRKEFLTKSKLDNREFELTLNLVLDGSDRKRKYRLAIIDSQYKLVIDSLIIKRSNKKEIKDFVTDCLLNLNDETIENVTSEISRRMSENEVPVFKNEVEISDIQLLKKISDFVRNGEVAYSVDFDKHGNVRINKDIFSDIIKEITGEAREKQFLQFLIDNDLLLHNPGRKDLGVNANQDNPVYYRAYCFKDYYSLFEEGVA